MIICASRRTDIPAFHSEWLMNRLRDGYCMVRNPVQRNVVHRIDLTRENVDMVLLMTKDPGPMMKHIDELISMETKFAFQVTITPYGKDIEPNVPRKGEVIKAFRQISEIIGKERMTWRYDPVILNDAIGIEDHVISFERLCGELQGCTERCTFSFLDVYKKLNSNIKNGVLRKMDVDEMMAFGKAAAPIAKAHGIVMNQCCSSVNMKKMGITNEGCISKEYLMSMGIAYEEQDIPLRAGCRCVRNIDIGDYDTCMHDCIYCYANSPHSGRRSRKTYDEKGEMIHGSVQADDRIVPLRSRQAKRITDF